MGEVPGLGPDSSPDRNLLVHCSPHSQLCWWEDFSLLFSTATPEVGRGQYGLLGGSKSFVS